MKLKTILYFTADLIRISFMGIIQGASGMVWLLALNWLWFYQFEKVLIPDFNPIINLIIYLIIPCFIIVFMISDMDEYKKNKEVVK